MISDSTKLMMSLFSAGSNLQKKVNRQLSAHGMSYPELLVLFQLSHAPQKTLNRIMLAEAINLTASGVTRLIGPMFKRGLLEREANPRDARESLVRLSDTGSRILDETFVSFEHTCEELLSGLDRTRQSDLLTLIHDLN